MFIDVQKCIVQIVIQIRVLFFFCILKVFLDDQEKIYFGQKKLA